MLSCVFLFALITLSPQLGKVIVQTGVGEAEFYLDGTFVAKSNANGLLTIESFPSGSFRFAVKKTGFITYEGSFTVAKGETKDLALKLQPIRSDIRGSVQGPRSKVQGPRSEVQGPRSEVQGRSSQVGPRSDVQGPKSNPASEEQPNRRKEALDPDAAGDSAAGSWLVLGTLILLPVGGSLVWKLYQKKIRGPRSEVRGPELAPEDEFMVTGPEEKQKWARTAPAFVEELKRKEDLIKAGFIGTKANEFDRQAAAGKEKEVVIVLPKEAYHYEEEK